MLAYCLVHIPSFLLVHRERNRLLIRDGVISNAEVTAYAINIDLEHPFFRYCTTSPSGASSMLDSRCTKDLLPPGGMETGEFFF